MKSKQLQVGSGSAAWASTIGAALVLFLSAANARASMDLTLTDSPDIFSAFITLNYIVDENADPSTGSLSVDGYAYTLKDGTGAVHTIRSSANPLAPGTLTLRATINADTGTLQPGGTVLFAGVVPGMTDPQGYLLTGNLTALGHGDAGDPLQFLFDVTGGAAAGLYGTVGGLILHTRAFPGDLSSSFHNSNSTSNAAGVVPEPAAIVVWTLLAVAGLAFTRRCRRRPVR